MQILQTATALRLVQDSPDAKALTLTDEESAAVADVIRSLPRISDVFTSSQAWLNEVDLCRRALPLRLQRALIRFRREGNDSGALIVRNMPVDPVLPATPADGRPSPDKATSYSEYGLLLTMLALGEPIAYLDEKDGALIQNICPVKGKEALQENTGSVYLEFHVEDGFHPNKPDYLGLACIRGDRDHQALTATSSIRRVLRKLPGHALDLLRQPLFRLRLSTSFGEGPRATGPIPVLTGHVLEPDLCVDHFLMDALTPQAQWALDLLKRLLVEAAEPIDLQPGDLILIDNRTAVHGRTGFTPHYDGADRWLQRMFVVQDARRSAASRGLGSAQCVPLALELLQDA